MSFRVNAFVQNPNKTRALGCNAKKVVYPIQNKVQNMNHAREIIIKHFQKEIKFGKNQKINKSNSE
jgi:hypothetical protein